MKKKVRGLCANDKKSSDPLVQKVKQFGPLPHLGQMIEETSL